VVGAAFSNATPPTIRTALTISRPQNCERNAPESVGTLSFPFLWELTAVRQAVETAWISASVRRTFIELLVPAGSSSAAAAKRGIAAGMYFIPPEMDPNFFVQKGFKFFTMPWGPWAKAGIQNGLSGIKR
jgi:hypothetical protein